MAKRICSALFHMLGEECNGVAEGQGMALCMLTQSVGMSRGSPWTTKGSFMCVCACLSFIRVSCTPGPEMKRVEQESRPLEEDLGRSAGGRDGMMIPPGSFVQQRHEGRNSRGTLRAFVPAIWSDTERDINKLCSVAVCVSSAGGAMAW